MAQESFFFAIFASRCRGKTDVILHHHLLLKEFTKLDSVVRKTMNYMIHILNRWSGFFCNSFVIKSHAASDISFEYFGGLFMIF